MCVVAAGIERVRAEVDAAFGALERECVELALAAAERVVRGRVERGELAFEEPLRALFAARRREIGELPAKLRVHPDDLERIAPKAAELAPPGARVELVADAALPRGDLALELGAARLVRSLDHELARLRERLLAGGDA